MDGTTTCEEGFGDMEEASPLTEQNYSVFQLCDVALCIVNLLLAVRSDSARNYVQLTTDGLVRIEDDLLLSKNLYVIIMGSGFPILADTRACARLEAVIAIQDVSLGGSNSA
ncbi:hypothetical protein Goari_026327, partial [Gossypium aridum]|nr:hypothetical protein [Gossypium aridum]